MYELLSTVYYSKFSSFLISTEQIKLVYQYSFLQILEIILIALTLTALYV